ncbi:hypothetical protein BV20DRAFT_237818 [Pilatotrama ljubarskyi]|nr:hypothetical protein BV20DRAFT_237818 [Pilatotrama ljubarskyi]
MTVFPRLLQYMEISAPVVHVRRRWHVGLLVHLLDLTLNGIVPPLFPRLESLVVLLHESAQSKSAISVPRAATCISFLGAHRRNWTSGRPLRGQAPIGDRAGRTSSCGHLSGERRSSIRLYAIPFSAHLSGGRTAVSELVESVYITTAPCCVGLPLCRS